MVKKKRILFLTAKMSLGGAERVMANLVNSLSDKVEVHTLLLYSTTQNDYEIKGTVTSLFDGKKRKRITELPYFVSRIKKYIVANEIDCVISFMEYPNLLNLITSSKTKKIISVRNFMSEKWKGKKGQIWKTSFKLLYPQADIIVCPTKLIRNDMELKFNIPSSKLKIIYNPYEIENINLNTKEAISEEYEEWFNGNTIITMGNLSKAKGHCHLIRAFSIIKNTNPKAKLVILGEGDYKKKLVALAEDLRVSKDILFLGFQKNPHKYLAKADIYVLTSYYEGFPNALAEAMVCKLPIISTDCKSGPREILAPTTSINSVISDIEYSNFGLLVPVFKNECFVANQELSNEEAILTKAVLELLEKNGTYQNYKIESQKRVEDFHVNKIINQWVETINE